MRVTRQMLEELFRLNGGPGEKTRLFANLNAATQTDLARMASVAPEEEPVIAYFDDQSEWLLVTTHRLIWIQETSEGAFDLVDLDRVERDLQSAMARQLSAHGNIDPSVKELIDRLHIGVADGCSATVSLEPGEPFYTMSGVLGRLCHWAHDWRQGRRW